VPVLRTSCQGPLENPSLTGGLFTDGPSALGNNTADSYRSAVRQRNYELTN
jgi:hypothetical protein